MQGARNTVENWIDYIGVPRLEKVSVNNNGEAIKITIGDIVLDGVIYDTDLAQEIKSNFPLTVSMIGYGGREYYGGIDFIPENIKDKGYYLLFKLLREIPPEIKTDICVEIGIPSEVIVEKAQDGQYDIIVMGSRGLGKIKSIFLGSISQYVLRYAHCPVLIVR